MTNSRIHYVSDGRDVPFFRAPELNASEHLWAGYSFEEARGPSEPLPCHAWSKTTLLHVFADQEQSTLQWKHRGMWNRDAMNVGTVSIVRRDVEIQQAVPDGSPSVMVLQIDNERLRHLAPDHLLTIDDSLVPVRVAHDPKLSELLCAMRNEVRAGCPSGILYSEAISISLLAYLAARFTSQAPSTKADSRFSCTQENNIRSYILDNLSNNISVTDLAELAQMSPSYFGRVFKSSFGETPYRFVMRQRVEAAKEMLSDQRLTATEIASALGFASQSHFLKVFRQFTDVTPRQFRLGS